MASCTFFGHRIINKDIKNLLTRQIDNLIAEHGVNVFYVGNITRDISGITTKAPCEVALIGERHVRIEISDFVMRTFVLDKITKE